MIDASRVSACLVTRGDVDMGEIIDSLNVVGFGEIIIWNNQDRPVDFGIYGRYAAIEDAKHDVIVTQDDDLIVTCWPELLAAYEPGVLTVNYPHPWNIPWVARGGIFDRGLPQQAFDRYNRAWPFDRDFTHYMCDGVFALLTENVRVIDHGSRDLPWCNDPGRVSTAPGWYDDKRPKIQERCEALA